MIETIKERLFEKAVLFGLFLLVCAARCQAQDFDIKAVEYDSITNVGGNGEIGWMGGRPIMIMIRERAPKSEGETIGQHEVGVDGLAYRGKGFMIGGILESNTPIDTTPPPTSIITAVHDGDSYYFRGLVPSNKFARLNGVDCPEISSPYVRKTQPYGREIGDSVRMLLKGRQITYTVYGLDKLKRPLVGVFVNETDVAEILLTKGWAWYYSPNNLPSATKRLYKSLERAAKKKKLGLWADPAAIKPTAWRKQHPGLK